MENGSFVKSPAFQVYPADFLADKNTLVMSTVEVGAYWLLILVCWQENGLPESVEELADIARMPLKSFQPSWERHIARCFIKREDGMWTHKRLEKERLKQSENRQKRSAAGQKGMNARWQRDNNVIANVEPNPDDGSPPVITPDNLSGFSFQTSSSDKDPALPPQSVFQQVTALIEFRGGSRETAGSFLGKCLKDYPKDEVESAASLAVTANAQDPRAYMRGILNGTARRYRSQAEMNSAGSGKVVL